MNSRIMEITPEVAKAFLSKSKGNRPIKRRKVEQYKADMLSGKWQLTPDGPNFDEDGVLKNAHHRLTAVVECGATIPMYVTFNVPRETTAYDIGDPRNAVQYLVYNEGMDKQLASNKMVAVARMHMYFLCGESRKKAEGKTYADLGIFLRENEDALKETYSLMSTQGANRQLLTGSSFGYAMFCALNSFVPFDQLKRFCEIVATGFYNEKSETSAIVLRNELISGSKWRNRDIDARAELSKIAQTALCDFIKGTPRTRPYTKADAVYTKKYFERFGIVPNAK